MILLKVAAILIGILIVFFGVWAGFEAKKPLSTIGAIMAPIGLIMALLAVLLLCVPGFFTFD